jgi:hypothetical protein
MYARHSGPLSREGSLSCHTCSNTGPRCYRSHIKKDRPIKSPLTTHKGMWRIYSNPNPHIGEKWIEWLKWRNNAIKWSTKDGKDFDILHVAGDQRPVQQREHFNCSHALASELWRSLLNYVEHCRSEANNRECLLCWTDLRTCKSKGLFYITDLPEQYQCKQTCDKNVTQSLFRTWLYIEFELCISLVSNWAFVGYQK